MPGLYSAKTEMTTRSVLSLSNTIGSIFKCSTGIPQSSLISFISTVSRSLRSDCLSRHMFAATLCSSAICSRSLRCSCAQVACELHVSIMEQHCLRFWDDQPALHFWYTTILQLGSSLESIRSAQHERPRWLFVRPCLGSRRGLTFAHSLSSWHMPTVDACLNASHDMV